MNCPSIAKRIQILGCLTAGISMRATTRISGVSINTVTKLLVDVGTRVVTHRLRFEESRRSMTREALADVKAGRTHEHARIEAWASRLGGAVAGFPLRPK